MKNIIIVVFLTVSYLASAQKGERMPLYNYDNPSMNDPALFINMAKKAKATGAAVLICPGGGYVMQAFDHEGDQIADWFNDHGVHAFILKYSLGKFDGSGSKHPAMINDVKRGFRMIRANAEKWGIDPNKIGVMGFSAGGHLASTLATHFDDGNSESDDKVEKVSCLPNYCILAYPVIMMKGEHTHWGSRRFLLGPTPSKSDVNFLSNDEHVSELTPPTFLFSTSDDSVVPVQNTINYYLALRKHGVPSEMHIFEHGKHGVGLAQDDKTLNQWVDLLEDWLVRWKVF